MVKEAFVDAELNERLTLTSANSINVARWLPQQLYYFLAYQQWNKSDGPPVISVPSGNLGNLCAGLLAFRRGLPVKSFIAACNENDVLSSFLATGVYTPHKAVATASNAMDVGDPSNFRRMLHLFPERPEDLKRILHSACYTDADVKSVITKVYNDYGYTLDPHGAVGYLALEAALARESGQKGFFLETAHPIKFNEVVEEATGLTPPFPDGIKVLLGAEARSIQMQPDYNEFRAYLESFS
jgi:threonine synthase